MQTSKTTLYFDSDLYFQIKKQALEERKTVTELLQQAAKDMLKSRTKPQVKKKFKSKLPPGLHLGPIKGNLTREEIYDFI